MNLTRKDKRSLNLRVPTGIIFQQFFFIFDASKTKWSNKVTIRVRIEYHVVKRIENSGVGLESKVRLNPGLK